MEKEERYLFKQIVRTFFVMILVLLWFCLPYLLPHIGGVQWDFNDDGKVSWSEYVDHEKREITKDDVVCTEYFSLKTGLPIRLVCPAHEHSVALI